MCRLSKHSPRLLEGLLPPRSPPRRRRSAAVPMPTSASPLEDCLLLLRGECDEQKLAGLLLAASVCRSGEAAALTQVYRAVGPRFLRSLLDTGLRELEDEKGEGRVAYLRLAVTVLAGLARVPEVAADDGIVSTVPLLAEILSKSRDSAIIEECFELLSYIVVASEDGMHEFCEPKVMDMITLQISSLADGSKCINLAITLMELLVHQLRADNLSVKKRQDMKSMVTCLVRLFDALEMLSPSLSPREPVVRSEDSLAPGFRFRPSDVELVSYYLKRKIMGKKIEKTIADVKLYDFAPWDLRGSRPNRVTPNGYWKASGKDRMVNLSKRIIGTKKTLVFYLGKVPGGERTNWVMHEYRLTDDEMASYGSSKDAYVLCKVFKKCTPGRSTGEQYGVSFDEDGWGNEQAEGDVLKPDEP